MRCLPLTFCVALATTTSGCGGVLSLNSRPRALDPGEVRIAFAQGVARSTRGDFVRSEPAPYGARATQWMTELSGHYGITDRIDVGTRVRPLARGAKLEGMAQIFERNEAPVELGVAVGIDGTHQQNETSGCDYDGGLCVKRRYWLLAADARVVAARELWRTRSGVGSGTLFAAVGYSHLYVNGRETADYTHSTQPKIVVEKRTGLPGGLWTAGLELGFGRFRLVPQVDGFTIRMARGGARMVVAPNVELAWEL